MEGLKYPQPFRKLCVCVLWLQDVAAQVSVIATIVQTYANNRSGTSTTGRRLEVECELSKTSVSGTPELPFRGV